jgi:hypothetical protein
MTEPFYERFLSQDGIQPITEALHELFFLTMELRL